MTMTDNKKLSYYLAAWNLSNPQLLMQTATSHIYTVTHDAETAILKLLSPSETDEQRGAVALRYFDGHGAVHLIQYDEGAHLLEYAEGDELITLVERGEDENATRIIAQVIKQLHSVPQDAPHDGLFTLDRWFGELFNKAAADRQMGIESIYVRSAPSPNRRDFQAFRVRVASIFFLLPSRVHACTEPVEVPARLPCFAIPHGDDVQLATLRG
jgi:streptomycin 6-kinase